MDEARDAALVGSDGFARRSLTYSVLMALYVGSLVLVFLLSSDLISSRDQAGYAEDIYGSSSLTLGEDSKAAVAFIYRAIVNLMDYRVFSALTFYFVLLSVAFATKQLAGRGRTILLILIPVVSLQTAIWTQFFSKEGLLVAILAVAMLCRRIDDRIGRIVLLSALALFVVYIREYYFPALITALIAPFVRLRWLLIALLAVSTIYVLVDGSIFADINSIRERIWSVETGVYQARSGLYLDFTSSSDLWTLISNYAYASVQIYLPLVFFDVSPKEVFLQLQVVSTAYLLLVASRNGDRFLSTFGLVAIATLPLFVGSAGTWARHASAISMMLLASLAWNWPWQRKLRLRFGRRRLLNSAA